jgi:hypothetical protein
MNYVFYSAELFEKELKKLSKKYKSLGNDIKKLSEEIQTNPLLGTNLGDGIKKIRLSIASKAQGKRGGARVITHEIEVLINEKDTKSVLFVSIYDKAEYDTVDLSAIKKIIKAFRDKQALMASDIPLEVSTSEE